MRITHSQLRKIIQEAIKTADDPNIEFRVGDVVEEKGKDTGLWQIVGIVNDRSGPAAKLQLVGGMLDRPVTTYVPVKRLVKAQG